MFSGVPLRERFRLERVLGDGPWERFPRCYMVLPPGRVPGVDEDELELPNPPDDLTMGGLRAEEYEWLERIHQAVASGDILECQRRLLDREPLERLAGVRSLLERLYVLCDGPGARAMVHELDIAAHPEMLPLWGWLQTRLTTEEVGDLLLDRLARSQLPAAEPVFCRVLTHANRGVVARRTALRGLARCGTPRSLPELDELLRSQEEPPHIKELAREAIQKIEARHEGARELLERHEGDELLRRVGLTEAQILLYADALMAVTARRSRAGYVFDGEPLWVRLGLERLAKEEGEGAPIGLHERILGALDEQGREMTRALLERLYESCGEAQLQALVRQIDLAEHASLLLPVWADMATQLSASTRKVLVERVAGAELTAASSFLERVAAGSDEEFSGVVSGSGDLGAPGYPDHGRGRAQGGPRRVP